MTTLALIGVGIWGKNYLHVVDSLDNCVIKYVCAQSQKTLDSLPNKYIKMTSSDKLLDLDIDGIIIASPASTHFEIAKKFLSQGCNLLIEKPLTTSYSQALELQHIWHIKKPKVLIGHIYLYNSAYQEFKKLFIRHIKTATSICFEGLSSPIRHDVSVIWDWGPHPVSLLLDLVKQPIIEVRATGSIENSNSNLYDTVSALILFANGIEASIHISWLGTHKVRKLTIETKSRTMELDYIKTTGSALTGELIEFIEAIQNSKKIMSDISMGVEVVRILTAIEQSTMNGGQLVKLDPIFSS